MSTPDPRPDLRPLFDDTASCEIWLATLPVNQPVQAQAQFLRQINLLNRHPLPGELRLMILETLRPRLLLIQHEAARRFAHRPLPLAPPEQAAFDSAEALWQALLAGYLSCLEAAANEAAALDRALLIERALGALADAQVDTYRAGYLPKPELWRQGHMLYSSAEQLGVADRPVFDQPHAGKLPSSPRAAYVELLLLHAASPFELPARQLAWTSRWARRWSGKVVIVTARPGKESLIYPLSVDLDSSEPASYHSRDGQRVRWLDTSALRLSLKKRINLLEQGAAPATLQLGDDCVQPACEQLLRLIYQRWCKGGSARSQVRRAVSGSCDLVGGIDAVHYYLSGRKPFRQPGHSSDDTLRRERDEIATFDRIAALHEDNFSREQGYQVEEWRVVEEWQMRDESAAGIHLVHPVGATGVRITNGQLVGIRPQGSQGLQLGMLRWVNVTDDAQIHAGVLMLPGRAEPVAVRSTGVSAAREPYKQAFLLPAVGALGSPATVLVPAGWFKVGRVIDISPGQTRQLRLSHLVMRGADFDQASYEVVS
jgi:cyclic-di-GMP-binding protein